MRRDVYDGRALCLSRARKIEEEEENEKGKGFIREEGDS